MATVTKRGKYWRAQIRRLGFPPQHKTFDTHAEAEAWARVVESEMDRGIFSSRRGRTHDARQCAGALQD